MLIIHEWIAEDGSSQTVSLGESAGALVIRIGDQPSVSLPVLALERVMERYGKPLADGVATDGPTLDLGGGQTLCRMRHRARYDVIARDFLVWSSPGREPLAELAVAVSGALVHLANATRGSAPPEGTAP
ncbi:MAG: hypothetical protein ACLQVI_23390 [Polyangiaceae bacterium]|jgi:hypothetical protein